MWREILDKLFVRAMRTRFDRLWDDASGSPAPKRRRSRRLFFETLEPRLLPSADLMPGGVLDIIGTDANDSLLILQRESDLMVLLNRETFHFDATQVTEIHASLLDGNDTFTFDHSVTPITPPLSFDGGAGNDALNLVTGSQAERIAVSPEKQPGPAQTNPGPVQIGVTDLASGQTIAALVSGTEAIMVNAGADDEFTLATNLDGGGLDGIAFQFNLGPDFSTKIDWSGPGDEGPEESITFVYGKLGALQLNGGAQNDLFNVSAGPDPVFPVQVDVANAATGRTGFHAESTKLTSLILNGGAGNDTARFDFELRGTGTTPLVGSFDGGDGLDSVEIVTTGPRAELIAIEPIPGQANPGSVEIGLTDIASGQFLGSHLVSGTEAITVNGSADDEFTIDNRNGGFDSGSPFLKFRFDTVFTTKIDWSGPGDEGPEESITFVYGKLGVLYIKQDENGGQPGGQGIAYTIGSDETGSVDLQATTAGGAEFNLESVGLADLTIKGGAGNDQFNVSGPLAAALHLFGGEGDDGATLSKCIPLVADNPMGSLLDLGPGNDSFQLAGTDADELIEILGVPDQTVPDPLIRVTDLATGIVTAEFTIVGAEAIAVDAAGGNDQVVMRDDDGPLTGIDWTMHTGRGDDSFVSIMSPRDPASGQVGNFFNLALDLGGGTDTSSLDVSRWLGQLAVNIVDYIDEDEAATPFSTKLVAQVEDGTFDLTARTAQLPGVPGELSGIDFVLSAHAMAQQSLFDWFTAGTNYNDVIIVDVEDVLNVSANIDAGAGDDQVTLGFSLSLNGNIETGDVNSELLDIDAGDGNDTVELNTAGSLGEFSASIATGEGDDTVKHRMFGIVDRTNVTLQTGGGNDAVEWEHQYEFRPGKFAHTDYNFELGDGDDTVDATFLGVLADVAFNLDTGSGNDTVNVNVAEADDIITGSGPGSPAHVKGFDGVTGAETLSFLPYGGFAGGVRVAAGDVNGDGTADIITGAGPGAAAHVKVFDGRTGAELRSFFAFDPSFTGGVFVAAGDVNGDGSDDIIVGTDGGAAPHVKVFDGTSGAEIRSFFAYAPTFTGGVRVAAGDVNGDGFDDIITGAGPGALSHVKVFDGRTSAELRSFFAYDPSFTGGVFVAAGDVNGDGRSDIIVGTDGGAAAQVKVFDGVTGAEVRSFLPYIEFTGGVRVAAGDVNGDGFADIITGAGPGAGPHVKVFDGRTGAELQSFFAYDKLFDGGVYVAAGDLNGNVSRPSDLSLAFDMGSGADKVALNWRGDARALEHASVQIDLGGADRLLPAVQDEVLVNFESGDVREPFVVGMLWNSEDGKPPEEAKSLHLDLTNDGEAIDVSAVLNGGSANNGMQLFFQGKLKVEASLSGGAGNDVINVNFAVPPSPVAPAGELDLTINGGAGNDLIGLLVPAVQKVRASLLGGDGNDTINANFALPPSPVAPASELDLTINGGAGNDTIGVFLPAVQGVLLPAVQIDGGDGDDSITAVLVNPGPSQEPAGEINLEINGGAGNDLIGLLLPAVQKVHASINGGAGNDAISVEKNPGPSQAPVDVDLLLDGGADNDSFTGTFVGGFAGNLVLADFETSTLQVSGNFNGTLVAKNPGPVGIAVTGTVTAPSIITATNFTNVSIGTLAGHLTAAGGSIANAAIGTVADTGLLEATEVPAGLNAGLISNTTLGTVSGQVRAGSIVGMTVSSVEPGGSIIAAGQGTTTNVSIGTLSGSFTAPEDSNPGSGVMSNTTIGSITSTGTVSTGTISGMSIGTAAGSITAAGHGTITGLSIGTLTGVVAVLKGTRDSGLMQDVTFDSIGGGVFAGNIVGMTVGTVEAGGLIQAAGHGTTTNVSIGTLAGTFTAAEDANPGSGVMSNTTIGTITSTGTVSTGAISGMSVGTAAGSITAAGQGTISGLDIGTLSGLVSAEKDANPGSGTISDATIGNITSTGTVSTGAISGMTVGTLAGVVTATETLDGLTAGAVSGTVSAGSVVGNIDLLGALTGTIRTTEGDFGRAFVDAAGKITGVTFVHAHAGITESGRIISAGDLVSFVDVQNGMSGVIAAQGDIGTIQTDASGNAILDSANRLMRFGDLNVEGGLHGAVVALGNIFGDLSITGGLDGRIAVRGEPVLGLDPSRIGILGNINIAGGIQETGAIVSAGVIGDDGTNDIHTDKFGTRLNVQGAIKGLIAAGEDINFGNVGSLKRASVVENATGANQAAIDAIFTHNGVVLMVSSDSDLQKILDDLHALRIGPGGRLTGTVP